MRIFTQGAVHFLARSPLLQHIIPCARRAQKIATNLESIGTHWSVRLLLLLLLGEMAGGGGGGDRLRGPDDWRVADGGGGDNRLLDGSGDHRSGLKVELVDHKLNSMFKHKL